MKGYTPAQIKKITNSLGNLVATSIPRNSSLRNRSFHEKVGASDRKVSYKFGSYSEIEVALSLNWGPEEILQRGLTLIDFISERWGFILPPKRRNASSSGWILLFRPSRLNDISRAKLGYGWYGQ